MSPRLDAANEALRRPRIGASEVAALLPCGHPYLTQADIYARIVHGVRRLPTPALEMGHDLEEVTLRLAARRLGIRPRRNRRTWLDKVLPLAATPDAIVPGTADLVEVKVVSRFAIDDWDQGPPAHVYAQCQAQMLVTGRQRVHVAAMLAGGQVGIWMLERDGPAIREIVAVVGAFFDDHIRPRVPPADTPVELVLTVSSVDGQVAASGDLLTYGDELAELAADREQAERREQEARGALILAMAAAGKSLVVAPLWTAEAKAAPKTGQVGLTFNRKRRIA